MLSLASNISATKALDFQYSIDFDGTNDYIDTGQNFSSVFNDSFSISLWVKPDDGRPSSTNFLFGLQHDPGTGNIDDIVRLELHTNGVIKFVFEGDTDTFIIETSGAAFSDGDQSSVGFTHVLIAMTKNSGSNSSADIFINGVDVSDSITNNITEAKHAAFSSTDNLFIGAINDEGTASNFFPGKIDEFAIFNSALDVNNALAIYNNGSPLNLKTNQGNYNSSSALQAYYRMGNGLLDDIKNSISTSTEQGIIVDQSGTVTIDADQSVAINTTNWEVATDNFNGQTPVGDGVITVDGTQTNFSSIRPKAAYWNKTVAGEFYRVEVHYTRSAGTVQFKATGDEGTNSGISLSAGSDVSVQQIGIGYIKANNTNWQLVFSSAFVGTVTKVVLQKITPNTSAIVKNGATRSDDTP
jgi:hypothetical protein